MKEDEEEGNKTKTKKRGEAIEKRRETEKERGKDKEDNLDRSATMSVHGALRVPREKRKGGRCSGDTCPECVPGTVARRGVRKIGAASGQAASGGECLEITCEVAMHAITSIRDSSNVKRHSFTNDFSCAHLGPSGPSCVF